VRCAEGLMKCVRVFLCACVLLLQDDQMLRKRWHTTLQLCQEAYTCTCNRIMIFGSDSRMKRGSPNSESKLLHQHSPMMMSEDVSFRPFLSVRKEPSFEFSVTTPASQSIEAHARLMQHVEIHCISGTDVDTAQKERAQHVQKSQR